MVTNVRNGTERDLDRELIEVLNSISTVSKRIAERITTYSNGESKRRGGEEYGERRRRTQKVW